MVDYRVIALVGGIVMFVFAALSGGRNEDGKSTPSVLGIFLMLVLLVALGAPYLRGFLDLIV